MNQLKNINESSESFGLDLPANEQIRVRESAEATADVAESHSIDDLFDVGQKGPDDMMLHAIADDFPQHKVLDYQALFGYLSNSVKDYDFSQNSYASYDKPVELKVEEPDHPKLSDATIEEVLKAAKLKNIYGIDSYVHPSQKALFDMWKMCNDLDLKLRYDLASV